MKIDSSPQDYIINATRQVENNIESDFLLRAIRIKNNTSKSKDIKEIFFTLGIEGKEVKKIAYNGEALQTQLHTLGKNVEQFNEMASLFLFGEKNFWDKGSLSSDTLLEEGQETGIILEHFKILKKGPVDECKLGVKYLCGQEEKDVQKSIPVQQYTNKNAYAFPLKGAWVAVNNYDNVYLHRRAFSQEFALDFVQLTEDFKLVPAANAANESYACYGQEIYAVASGEVIDCAAEIPENPPGFGSRLPDDEMAAVMEKHGFLAGMAGNYVVIEHPGNEYSFYAHLIPGSLEVVLGEKVEQGQLIGLVGNSGNSDAPHLHFQLMNGSSFFNARGLPCCFNNIKDITGEKLPFIEEDNTMVHTF